ncbi:MAG: aldose epimerase family protein [Paracoccaceae bacterium]
MSVAQQITLNAGDLTVRLLTLGATVQDVMLEGVAHSLTLGSGDLSAYGRGMEYFGAIVGPVANRIAGASASLGGKRLRFDANERGVTTLHGGRSGTHSKVWQLLEQGDKHARMQVILPDGEGGFPGNRTITAAFRVEEPGSLRLDLSAKTDADTFINLANHSYWNLDGTDTIEGHKLSINAEYYTPVDRTLIPEGHSEEVAGTPFDFREMRAVGVNPEVLLDHNFCLAGARGPLRHACRLEGQSGISLEIETTEPGLQVYDGSSIQTAPWEGIQAKPYGAYAGLALEPQSWPDAPNRPGFPRVQLAPGQLYSQTTFWHFKKPGA